MTTPNCPVMRKAHKSRHFWHFKPTKENLWGFLWWINVDKLSICGSWSIDLNFLHISSQKWLVFANYFGLPNFLPHLANFFTRIYPSYPWHFPTLASLETNLYQIYIKFFLECRPHQAMSQLYVIPQLDKHCSSQYLIFFISICFWYNICETKR